MPAKKKNKPITFKNRLTFKNITLSLILSVCLIWLVIWLVSVIQNINQHQIEYSEGLIIYLSRLFNAGQFNYTISETPPFMVSFYTPLYYLIYGKLISIFGDPWIVGRILMIMSTLGCMLLVYLIVLRVSKNKLISLISALLPLTQYVLVQWSMVIRVDMMAVFFELAGIYLAVRFWKSKWILLSIPLFLLAFYTKQSYFVGAIAVAIALFFENWRRAFVYVGTIGTLLIISLGIAQRLTDGQFLVQIIQYQSTYPFFKPLSNMFIYDLITYYSLIPILFYGLLWVLHNRKNVLGIFALLAFIINIFFLCKAGAAANYQFEVIFSFCIIGGMAIPYFIKTKEVMYITVFILIAISSFIGGHVLAYPSQDYQAKYKQAEEIIADATYPILSENVGIVIDAGKDPYLVDPFMFMQFPRFGYFEESKLVNDLKSQKIEYVITQEAVPQKSIIRFNPPVQQAISDNYRIVLDNSNTLDFGFVVYKAKNMVVSDAK